VTGNVNTGTNTISWRPLQDNWLFNIWTDDELTVRGVPKPFNSINSVLQNYVGKTGDALHPWVSGYIDFHAVRNVYIHSPNLGTYSTLSLRGARDIIKKVPVNANYNEVIFNNVMTAQDYLDCSRQTLSRLEFRLEDVFGNVLDLHGNHWSFSIIFAKFDNEM
jgi:hypothetical protein